MLRAACALLLLLPAFPADWCNAANLPVLFSAGINTNGARLKESTIDPHWRIALSPAPGSLLTNAYVVTTDGVRPSIWVPNMPASQWIALKPLMATSTNTAEYRYRTTFDLSGADLSTLALQLMVASDNEVTAVLLNDHATGIKFTNGPSAWSVKEIANGFSTGTNTLELMVTNSGVPSGLNCRLTATETPMSLPVQAQGTNITIRWRTNALATRWNRLPT